MTVRAAFLFLLFTTLAASAEPATSTTTGVDLPVPPQPPSRVPTPDLAPVPDPDSRIAGRSAQADPDVQIRFFRSDLPDPSAGFAPGSHFQTPEERKPIQTPGLSVNVPIQ